MSSDGPQNGESPLAMSILRGRLLRRRQPANTEVEDCREQFLAGAENALWSRPKDEGAVEDEQIRKLKEKMEISFSTSISLKEGMRGHPFGCKMLDE